MVFIGVWELPYTFPIGAEIELGDPAPVFDEPFPERREVPTFAVNIFGSGPVDIAVAYVEPTAQNADDVRCSPASGSRFPIGETTVLCIATNDNHSISKGFTVNVLPPGDPRDLIRGVGISGVATSPITLTSAVPAPGLDCSPTCTVQVQGEPLTLNDDGRAVVQQSEEIRLVAEGLEMFTPAVLQAFSTPVVLATAIADETGRAELVGQIPPDFPPGEHTLVIERFEAGRDGLMTQINIPLLVLETPEEETRPAPAPAPAPVPIRAGSPQLSAPLESNVAAAVVEPIAATTMPEGPGLALTGTDAHLMVLLGMALMFFGAGLTRTARTVRRSRSN